MKIGSRSEGFTIVETLIVLLVTGFLFAMAVVMINGKQNKAEFTTGARNLESRLRQAINEVSNGYYPNNDSFSCKKVGSAPAITTGSGTPQGGNKDCIFLGKVIQFNVGGSSNPELFQVYSVVGLREASAGTLATTLTQANPRVINVNGAYDIGTMPYDMTTVGAKTDAGAVGFISNLSSPDIPGPSQQIDVYPLTGVNLGDSMAAAINTIENGGPKSLKATTPNPSGGVRWCVKSGGTDQSALYTIGGQGRQLTVSYEIKNGPAC